MNTREFAKEALESLLYVDFAESTATPSAELAPLQTDDTKAVIRFRADKTNHCVVATAGFCNKTKTSFLVMVVAMKIHVKTMPGMLPNGAEVPLWLTEQDAYEEAEVTAMS